MLGEGILLQCCLHLKLGCLFTNTNIEQRILHVWSVKERVRAWHYTDTDTTFQHYAPLHHLPLIIKHKYKHKLVDIQYISNEDQTSRYSWVGPA